MSDVGPADLDVGACFEFPDGDRLVVVGVLPAEETPESERDGPLYQAEIRDGESAQTFLYGPHNIRQGVAGGAEYVGTIDVEEERTPFWCEGCKLPHKAEERKESTLLRDDADVCSYGCAKRVGVERRKAKQEARR